MDYRCAECGRPLSDVEGRMGVIRCSQCDTREARGAYRARIEERRAYDQLFAWVQGQVEGGRPRGEIVADLEAKRWPKDVVTQAVDAVEGASTQTRYAGPAAQSDPTGDFVVSAVASAIGGGVTWGTFAAADPGGGFLMLWGPAVFGAWKFVQGAVRYLRHPTGAALALGILALGMLVASLVAFLIAIDHSGSSGNHTTSQQERSSRNVPAIPAGKTNIFDLEAGDCFSESLQGEIGYVTLVPCDGATARVRVTKAFEVDRSGSYPGVSYFEEQMAIHCPLEDDWYLSPTGESWGAGDRTITCLRSLR